MSIQVKKKKGLHIFDFGSKEISQNTVKELIEQTSTLPKGTKLAFNMKNIHKVSSSFFDFLSNFKSAFYELNEEILAYFVLTKAIDYTNVYMNELDLFEDKRRMIKRNFRVV